MVPRRDNGPYVRVRTWLVDARSQNVRAPDLDGYSFAFWLEPSTVGFVDSAYMEPADRQSSSLWNYAGAVSGCSIRLGAVYVRDGLLGA